MSEHKFQSVPTRGLVVHVPPDVMGNLEKMQVVTRNLLGRLGCLACHSGFNIQFQEEVEFLVNERSLEVTGLAAHTGGSFGG